MTDTKSRSSFNHTNNNLTSNNIIFPSIPSLYYKLEEEDLMSAYICSPDSSYGMHKCRNLPHYKAGVTQDQLKGK